MFRWDFCWQTKDEVPYINLKKTSKNHKNPFEDMAIFYGNMDISTQTGVFVRISWSSSCASIGEVLNVWPTWRSPSLGAERIAQWYRVSGMELQGWYLEDGLPGLASPLTQVNSLCKWPNFMAYKWGFVAPFFLLCCSLMTFDSNLGRLRDSEEPGICCFLNA